MTNNERIAVLKRMLKQSSSLLPSEEESLRWAIKICEKYETKSVANKEYGNGWNNPPRFNSIEERDMYYK